MQLTLKARLDVRLDLTGLSPRVFPIWLMKQMFHVKDKQNVYKIWLLSCEGSEITLILAFPIMQISSNLVMNHIFQLLKVIPHCDTNVFTG